MPRMYDDVLEFHQKHQFHEASKLGDGPDEKSCKLRGKMVLEEAKELSDALKSRDLEKIADSIIDLYYVIIGAQIEWGIDGIDELWEEVHAANSRKEAKDVSGKVVKPPGWRPPNITEALKRLSDAQSKS